MNPRVEEKDPEMSSKMEEFITNTIIIEKDGNGGNMSKMADGIKKYGPAAKQRHAML